MKKEPLILNDFEIYDWSEATSPWATLPRHRE